MKKALLIILVAAAAACNTKEKELKALKSKIEPTIKTYFNTQFVNQKVDSVIIYEIDTLTEKRLERIKYAAYFQLIQDCHNEVKKLEEEAKPYQRLLDISYDTWASNHLQDIKEKYRAVIANEDKYYALSAKCLEREAKADSTKFINYLAHVNIKATSTDMVQRNLDSLEVIITQDYKIKLRKDYIDSEIENYITPTK